MSDLDMTITPEQAAAIDAGFAAERERAAEWARAKALPLPDNVVVLKDWKREHAAIDQDCS